LTIWEKKEKFFSPAKDPKQRAAQAMGDDEPPVYSSPLSLYTIRKRGAQNVHTQFTKGSHTTRRRELAGQLFSLVCELVHSRASRASGEKRKKNGPQPRESKVAEKQRATLVDPCQKI
jgi:hypothetical protein